MNHSISHRILRSLGIVAVLALAGVGLEHTVASLFRASGTTATVVAQPPATATVAAPPPPPAPVQVEVEGNIIAVDAAAGTITIQDDDGGPATVVALGAVGTYYVGQEVKVVGTLSGAGGSATTVQAQYVTLDDAPAPTGAPVGTHVEAEGLIEAVDPAAGTITVQDDDGPSTVVSVSAAGTYHVGQEVEVAGIVASAGSNGATVRAQFIRLKSWDGDDDDDD
jgi:hypothetical protein